MQSPGHSLWMSQINFYKNNPRISIPQVKILLFNMETGLPYIDKPEYTLNRGKRILNVLAQSLVWNNMLETSSCFFKSHVQFGIGQT